MDKFQKNKPKDDKLKKTAPPGRGGKRFSKHEVGYDTEREMLGKPQRHGAAMKDPIPHGGGHASGVHPPAHHGAPHHAGGGLGKPGGGPPEAGAGMMPPEIAEGGEGMPEEQQEGQQLEHHDRRLSRIEEKLGLPPIEEEEQQQGEPGEMAGAEGAEDFEQGYLG